MEIRFNVTGTRRKEMVGIISEVIGMKAVYKFMPTCAFVIDNLTISKDGTLIADDRTDNDTIRKVLEAVEAAGFKAESIPEELLTEKPAEEAAPKEELDGLVVSMPLDGFTESALDNLRKLVDSKHGLIMKALGTTDRAEKTKLYTEVQEEIWKDAPWAFLVTEKLLYATSKKLTGMYVMPDANYFFEEIDLQ